MSVVLYLCLKTDICVSVWNRDNTMLTVTCQVTWNIWSKKTVKKQCQSGTVQDQHWEAEKERSTWKISGWQLTLLKSMHFSAYCNSKLQFNKSTRQKEEKGKALNQQQIKTPAKPLRLGDCSLAKSSACTYDHTSSNLWKHQHNFYYCVYIFPLQSVNLY